MLRRLILVTLFGVAIIVVTALNHTRKVHATSDQDHQSGCSVASLKGTYAFLNTGVTNTGLDGPVAELGIAFFNGDGKRGPIRSTASINGVISDWTNSGPHGSYTIDPDCTGSFFAEDGTKTYNIVVLDGGKRFLLLDLQPGTTISAEVTRLGDKD
jgi:hypothetical protein